MSSYEINHYLQEYKTGVTSLGDLVTSLGTKSEKDEKDAIIGEFEKQIQHLKEIGQSFKLETRLLKDRSERTKYETDGSVLEKRIADYKGLSFVSKFIHKLMMVTIFMLFLSFSQHR